MKILNALKFLIYIQLKFSVDSVTCSRNHF